MKLLFSFLILLISVGSFSQVNVCLNTWYNHEMNSKTGLPFHYLWQDKANSGFSELGDIFVSRGAKLTSLESSPSKKSLSGADIYIIVDPDTTSENPNPNYIGDTDIKIIKKWVKKGGVLLLLANDAPNCEFTHLNKLARQFGMSFNPVTLNPVLNSDWEMGAETNLPDHALFRGVKKIYLKEVASINVSGSASVVLSDGEDILIAETKHRKGFVLAVGDPWLYNEYIDHRLLPVDFENLKAANNLVDYLIAKARK